jgi:protein-tyrosine phosphatase
MFTKIYWIHQLDNAARLGIMARPRGGDWLADEIANLKKQKVGVLVSLLEKEEINELGLRDEEVLCKTNSIEFLNFPIVDRDVPKANDKTDWFINYLTDSLQAGASIVIHCRMGIGRSSIIAAAILSQFGQGAGNIINEISRIRGLKVPDTAEQLQWLKARSKK